MLLFLVGSSLLFLLSESFDASDKKYKKWEP